MSNYTWPPRTGHVITVEPDRPTAADVQGLKVKAARAEVRGIEARRRADELQAELAGVNARVAELEHPTPPPEPEPERPAHVAVGDRRHVSSDDADWIVDGWREHGWQ